MAFDITFKIDKIAGESMIADHVGEIDVQSYSWGMSQTGSFGAGGGGGAGKVNVQDLSFTKNVDKSSPNLFAACAAGTHIATAVLSVRKAGGSALDYLKVELEDILISSVNSGGAGGGDTIGESVSLNFAKYKVTYQQQKKDGTKEGGPVTTGFDIKANKKIG